MKLIRIQQYTTPQIESVYLDRQKYKVTLGNNHASLFGSKREVIVFLTSTNKYLNTRILELNIYYIDLFDIYRSAWIYYDSPKYKSIDRNIKENIQNIDKNFEMIFIRTSSPNGNHLAWSFFNKIINDLIECLGLLAPLFRYKGHVDRIVKINALIEAIEAIKKELVIYPETEENLKRKLEYLLL